MGSQEFLLDWCKLVLPTPGELFNAQNGHTHPDMRIRVVCFGLGPIGLSIARLVTKRNQQLEIVGAIDSDARLFGRDLGSILGQYRMGLKIAKDTSDVSQRADVVLHATTSFLTDTKDQLLEFCRKKLDVVSTCEELAYPWFKQKAIAEELDDAAKKNGITILGTGVNPGFVLDAMAITLSGACQSVREVKATRILDATMRRIPFQRKVGIGLTPLQFKQNVLTGRFGHVGLPESIALTCKAMGLEVSSIDQKISPKIARSRVKTKHFGVVPKGKVIGLVQKGKAFAKGRRVATYHIETFAGAKNAFDEIELVGVPRISMRIPGGTPGDVTTAAVIVNSISRVVESQPGLMSVKDLRPASGPML